MQRNVYRLLSNLCLYFFALITTAALPQESAGVPRSRFVTITMRLDEAARPMLLARCS
ncbi:MAG: hypothetical protein H0X25_00520 [Acidobacteriales bacterium]|nr:hypothetical protein [Terriglobales bacterium]